MGFPEPNPIWKCRKAERYTMRLYVNESENTTPEAAPEKRALTTGEKILVGTLVAGGVGASIYCVHLAVNAVASDAKAVGTGIKAGVDKLKTNKEKKQAALQTLMAAGYTEEEAKALL